MQGIRGNRGIMGSYGALKKNGNSYCFAKFALESGHVLKWKSIQN